MPTPDNPNCEAQKARKSLIEDIYAAMGMKPEDGNDGKEVVGTQAELLDAFFYLEGVVAEYTDGGDEVAEGCTCPPDHPARDLHVEFDGITFDEMYEAFKYEARHPQQASSGA